MTEKREPFGNVACGIMRLCISSLTALLLGLVILSSEDASAQNKSPKGFFKKDYAEAPGAQGRDVAPPSADAFQGRRARSATNQAPPPASQQNTAPTTRKRRIIISVYVNSADKEHFMKVLDELYTIHDEKRAFVVSLVHIGDYRSVTPEVEGELAQRNINLMAASELPSVVPATSSPVWMIQTQEGVHIAEGIIDIHSFFNEYGEYDPKRRKDPSLEGAVEGF